MGNYVYEKIVVSFKDNNGNEIDAKYICSFDDQYLDEIIIGSAVKIDGINRGWVGDMFRIAEGAYNVEECSSDKKKTSASCFKDVLCARVTACFEYDHVVRWKYTFLKC
jgi:hypothetical protein